MALSKYIASNPHLCKMCTLYILTYLSILLCQQTFGLQMVSASFPCVFTVNCKYIHIYINFFGDCVKALNFSKCRQRFLFANFFFNLNEDVLLIFYLLLL